MGLAIGDAVGLPYRFSDKVSDVDMMNGNTSVNTDMTLCLARSLLTKGKVDCMDIMGEFKKLHLSNVAGISSQVKRYINLFNGSTPFMGEDNDSNWALARILPMAYINCTVQEVWQVCCITNTKELNKVACTLYVFIAKALINGLDVKDGIEHGFQYFTGNGMLYELSKYFGRLPLLQELTEEDIKLDHFTDNVIYTLEAAVWSVVTTDNFKDCILKSVSLGGDTNTIAAVAGGLAGIKYGVEKQPKNWINMLKCRDFIEKIVNVQDDVQDEM